MKNIAFVLIGIFLAWPSPAADEWEAFSPPPVTPGAAVKPTAYQAKDAECYIYPDRTVLLNTTRRPDDTAAQSIAVLKNTAYVNVADLCRMDPRHVVFKPAGPTGRFMALWRDLLVLNAEEVTGGRLLVYRMSKSSSKKPVYAARYEGMVLMKQDGVLTLNVLSQKPDAIQGCEAGEGLQPALAIETELDLRTLKPRPTGQNKCVEL